MSLEAETLLPLLQAPTEITALFSCRALRALLGMKGWVCCGHAGPGARLGQRSDPPAARCSLGESLPKLT